MVCKILFIRNLLASYMENDTNSLWLLFFHLLDILDTGHVLIKFTSCLQPDFMTTELFSKVQYIPRIKDIGI